MPFPDPQLGVYTSTFVQAGAPVLVVFHDADGDWQFLTSFESHADEIVLAHVAHLLDSDRTLRLVADLPLGWKAWRDSPDEPWQREPTPEDQWEF